MDPSDLIALTTTVNRAWGLSLRSLTPFQAQGYANRSLVAQDDQQGRFLLRISRQKDRAGVEDEARLLVHLNAHGIPIALPRPTLDGGYALAWPAGPLLLMPFLPGVEAQPDGPTVTAIGTVMGRLATLPWPDDFVVEHGLGLSYCRQWIAEASSGPGLDAEQTGFLQQQCEDLHSLLAHDLPHSLVHGDLFPDNTLFEGGRLIAILDWDEACLGPRILDPAMAVLGFAWDGDHANLDRVRAMARSYQKVCPWETQEVEAFHDWVRFSCLGLICWHLRSLRSKPRPRQWIRVAELIEHLRRLERGPRLDWPT